MFWTELLPKMPGCRGRPSRTSRDSRMMGLSAAWRWISVKSTSGLPVKKRRPCTGGSSPGSPRARMGHLKLRRLRPTCSSTMLYSSMMSKAASCRGLSVFRLNSGLRRLARSLAIACSSTSISLELLPFTRESLRSKVEQLGVAFVSRCVDELVNRRDVGNAFFAQNVGRFAGIGGVENLTRGISGEVLGQGRFAGAGEPATGKMAGCEAFANGRPISGPVLVVVTRSCSMVQTMLIRMTAERCKTARRRNSPTWLAYSMVTVSPA